MTSIVVDFSPAGEVQAMHKDGFSLAFLGHQRIDRASDIRFNETTQKWDLYLANHMAGGFLLLRGARGFDGYDTAREVEVSWLNACRLHGYSPFSIKGSATLEAIRAHKTVP